ncbi:transposase, IS605 OrfB family, central region [Candidatus Methanoperedens nitroreducens]|uniref:Transposase, IS605 OrfB family, central region n=1 Tax=Candidatus Methanoperedens nitratireducens TaxID=1392998 RepID=A0A062V572_9EURY|nr:RNA-guided endonuclease TnpB family protein [Candidatus Methanoperedens nitroreducens]KCZ71763.1 transposase, IS605 OrfB family, central region [Candidatus Methanoperedens nitroreducens]MDJ1422264.1 transposase [Candidatus Methanoperedens sp.]
MKKAYSFRIYPNKNQEVKLNRTLNTCRHLYNDALAERRKQAELNRLKRELEVFPWGKPEWISYEYQANELASSKTDFQKEVHSQVLQNTLKRLDRSFKNFYNGFGYPRFKGRNRYNTFTYPQSGFELKDNDLKLSKIGTVRIFQHREMEGKIKTCTIKKDVDQWYAVFTVEIEKKIEKVPVETKIGIDVGLRSLLTLSNGKQIEPPKYFRKSEIKLAWEQVQLSTKKLGSKNRNKQRIKVAKVHRKIRNQRKDFAHKTGRWLVNTYDHIVFEDLQIQNMLANHHLAKSISDAGWYQLISLTKSKAEHAGKIVELVNPKNTSQVCICGYQVPKDLCVRIHSCPNCGLVIGRDHVSAILIGNKSKIDTVPTDCGESRVAPLENADTYCEAIRGYAINWRDS